MSRLNALAHTVGAVMENIAARTTTLTGTGIDVTAYEGVLEFEQWVGAVTGTTPTLDGKLQTSDVIGSGYVDIPGATFAQVTASNNRQFVRVAKTKCKKFVRYVGTKGGTTPNYTYGVGIQALPKYE